ncbi:MAG: two-component system cell cycle response regulator [Planctomycetota bacterium]|jgi:two-component system cell cycle response regulator
MSDRPTVIVAHYDAETLSSYRAELESDGFRVQATSSGSDVLKKAEAQAPDAIVLEALLPKQNGLSVLKHLKGQPGTRLIPIIMLLDDGDTYTENRALICGADAILKRGADGNLAEGTLAAKLHAAMKEASLGSPADQESPSDSENLQRILDTAAQNLRQENPVLAHITDSLTGLYNAEYMEIKLAEEFKRSRRFGVHLAIVDIQLHLGAGGEEHDKDSEWRHVLNEVAGMLLCESRDIDILGRQDATTFRLLLPHTPVKGAETMVERILTNVAARKLAGADGTSVVTAAAGITKYNGEDVEAAEELKRRTKDSLRQAWREGGSCLVVWSSDLGGESLS